MKTLLFSVTDHNADNVCTSNYKVEYRAAGADVYNTLYPYPAGPDIAIPNLTSGQSYEVRVSRTCCDSIESDPTVFTATIPE
ncbi:MAG: hypothetical protein EOP52_13495 [Sphingobacteriales bacterium]|nr:MAG: hypothetical protein EOP52_13495 [Sphingobacteriales bacterium]